MDEGSAFDQELARLQGTGGKEPRPQPQGPQGPRDRRDSFQTKEAERKRRRTIRHECKVVLEMLMEYGIAGSDEKMSKSKVKVKGRVLDLSATGAAFFTKDEFQKGQDIKFALVLQNGATVSGTATVKWTKPITDKNGCAMGVLFTDIPSEEQKELKDFLAKLDETFGL